MFRQRKKLNYDDVLKNGILAGLAQVLYTSAIVFIMSNMGNFFQTHNEALEYLAPLLMLLLFVFSAGISGLIILGYPTFLFFQKKHLEAGYTLLISLATIFIIAIFIFLIIINL